jgi:hypothetical protein
VGRYAVLRAGEIMFYLVRKSLIFYVSIFLLKMGSLQKTHYQGCSTPWIRKHLSNVSLIERLFFISSLPADAKRIAAAVRAHWLIESAPQAHEKEVYVEHRPRACA